MRFPSFGEYAAACGQEFGARRAKLDSQADLQRHIFGR
jgi:hypothetical protein